MAKTTPPPTRKVVVTPRMLRAGAIALATLGGEVTDYERVGVVYRAMASVAPATKAAEPGEPANFLEVMRIMRSGRRDV